MSRPIRVAHITTIDLSLRFLMLGQLRGLRDAGFEVAGISAPGPWSGALEAEGIRHIPWPSATRAWNPRADARAFFELLRILQRERFDVVHTHNPKPGLMGRVAARMARAPCVVNTVHGLYATPDDPLARKVPVLAVERLARAFSDLELYQSEEDLVWARRTGVASRGRSELLGNGVDIARFDPRAVPPDRTSALRSELGVPDGAPVVATVARLVDGKGCRELFAAARDVRAALPEARFLVIGTRASGDAGAIPERELARAREDVIFTGWREDLPELLTLVDVFVLASRREGVPRSAIEAAAMGKALILTDIRGCREVVRDGVDGMLVPARDPARLAAAIKRLLRDRPMRQRLGAAARERAVERFDETRVTELTIRRYRDILERSGRLDRRHGPFRLRIAHPADAGSLAVLHREGLPDAFLPALGDRFLRRLYRAFARDSESVVVVAEADGEVVGFATGVVSMRRFRRRFYLRHGVPALAAAAPRLARAGVARRASETASLGSAGGRLPDSQLASVAVAPGWTRRGVGRALVDETVSRLGQRGAREVAVVAGAANEQASRLYSGAGFRRAGSVAVHGGEQSNVWVAGCPS